MKQFFLPIFLCTCFIGLSAILWAIPLFPIHEVIMEGDIESLDQKQLKFLLNQLISKGFFFIKINKIQSILQGFSTIDTVEVQKMWPDKLLIDIRQQQPMATWLQKNTYLNPYGEIFSSTEEAGNFPLLSGAADNSTKVLAWYQQMNTMLQVLGRKISQLSINSMNEWRVVLDNGTQVMIGPEKVLEKVTRFVYMYPKIAPERTKQAPKTIDLRYENGMSIQWGAK